MLIEGTAREFDDVGGLVLAQVETDQLGSERGRKTANLNA
jgi:hypothetical protein